MGVSKRLIGAGATASGALTPSENFKVVTYTGNSSTQAITGVGFKPDFVWTKVRVGSNSWHFLADSTRGGTKVVSTNSSNAEQTRSNHIQSFDSDGFTLGNDGTSNYAGETYVAWCWKANGGTTSTNNDGDVASTVQANTDAGFSIVKYTANGNNNSTIGHGLGAAPEMILIKKLTATGDWITYHKGVGTGNFLYLNRLDDELTQAGIWSSVGSSTFNLISGYNDYNQSGQDYIAYCFAPVDGFSKFGTYIGTGDADDRPIIETGFEPAFVMIKSASTGGSTPYHWNIYDNKRNKTNPRNLIIEADTSDAELTASTTWIDFLSNGFQIGPATSGRVNGSGITYIYMAFAADPDTEAPTLASSFNIETYRGNSTTHSISGLGFSPSLVWNKARTDSRTHNIYDSVRGAGELLTTNNNNAEQTVSVFDSFDSDGFTISGSDNYMNNSSHEYVAWAWKADDNEPTIKGGAAQAVYKFEDNGNDVTGNNNATATSITYGTGKFNKGAIFNGTTSNFKTGSSFTGTNGGSFTLSFWVKIDDVSSNENILLGRFSYTTSDKQFILRVQNGGTVRLNVYNSSGTGESITTTDTLSIDTWYHIVAVVDGTKKSLYIDGQLSKSETGSISSNSSATGFLEIGGSGHLPANDAGRLDGMMDQVRIYNGAVSDIGAAALYGETVSDNDDTTLGGPPETIISANANAGFSISKATFAGEGTIPHGLSQAPELVILKGLSAAEDWQIYHSAVGTGKYLSFSRNSGTDAPTTRADSFSSVTATTVTNSWTSSSVEWIMYSFHSVTGYQKIGSYTGDGNNDRAITTGFKPDFVMIKSTVGSDNWRIYDTRRGIDDGGYLEPNRADADDTSNAPNLTMTSTGFTITSGGVTAGNNANGNLYIYWAIAKNVPNNTTLADSFSIKTYTGTSAARSITGLGFSPGLVWTKDRSNAEQHQLHDIVRGATHALASNLSNAEATRTGGLTSFDSDGFSLGSDGGGVINDSSRGPYVAWSWKAGNTWQSNVDGNVNSIVNYNTHNKFSIVRWTGTGSATTVGHGLGTAPTFIIGKTLDSSAKWRVYHSGLSSAANYLNLNDAFGPGSSSNVWNSTAPTSSVFSVGTDLSPSGEDMIAYVWADVTGYSKFGTYTGTGSSQTITTGFEPNFIITKDITLSSDNWRMYDTVRGLDEVLYPGLTNAEEENATGITAVTSTGFTLGTGNLSNRSSSDYIYIAFKMNPTPQPISGYMSFLVLAGGASGASNGGGGGAGGLRTSFGTTSGGGAAAETDISLSSGTYTITIGGGGAGLNNTTDYQDRGNAGSNSTITGNASVSTNGGGAPGSNDLLASSGGGCGGGQGAHPSVARTAQAGTSGEGYAGGATPSVGHPYRGGGGGGTGQAGFSNNAGSNTSNGGDGLSLNITGSSANYGGGGGGTGGTGSGYTGAGGTGGAGGGGNGGAYNGSGTAGTANTGGGGGATGDAGSHTSGAGGSGVVILRLLTSEYSGSTTGSPTVTTDGDYTVIKYTGSGTYVHS